jgi:Domain of unknown function (DUF4431)
MSVFSKNLSKIGFSIIVATSCVLPTFAHAEGRICSQDWLDLEPTKVNLNGLLVWEQFFGPPDYGEGEQTDSLEKVALLLLPLGVNVADSSQETNEIKALKCETVMQVIIPAGIAALDLPHRVEVRGSLFFKQNGHHRTNVLISADEIKYMP